MNLPSDTYLFAQALAVVSFVLSLAGPQLRTRKQMLVIYGVANIFASVHFWLLGATTGAIIVMIAAVRFFIFTASKAVYWLFVILVANAVALLFATEGIELGALAFTASGLVTIAAFSQNNHQFRILFIIGMFVWLLYDAFIGSVVASLEDVFFLGSSILGYIRHRKVVWGAVK